MQRVHRGDFQMHKCAGVKQEYKANKNTNDNCHIHLFKRIDTLFSRSPTLAPLFHICFTCRFGPGSQCAFEQRLYIAFSQTCIVFASKISEIFVKIVISIEHQWLLNIEWSRNPVCGYGGWSDGRSRASTLRRSCPGFQQALRRNGSWSPYWILAKFQITSVLQDVWGKVGRKEGEDE